MRRTRATTIVVIVLVVGVIAYILDMSAVSAGLATLAPPLPLGLTLLVVGGVVVAFAVPISRSVRGRSGKRIDPFQAVRVAALAKSCSLAGAVATGAALGLMVYALTRSVVPAEAAGMAVFLVVAAILLTAAGLVSEFLCTLPPDTRDDDRGGHPQRV